MDFIGSCRNGMEYFLMPDTGRGKTGYAFLLLLSLVGLSAPAATGNITISSLMAENSTTRESREIQCLPFRQTFGPKMGLDSAQVPRRAINGDHLTICSKETTCCTQDMENKLSISAKQDYDKLLNEYVSKFKALLVSRTTKFDDYFTELIRNARHNLHTMFIRTYGPLYEKNAIIFTELFDDLERYYRGNRGHVDLQVTMNRFFSRLFQKMFALLNAQYTLDNAQLQCVARHMDKVKPFGDVAEKLSQQVKRAFIDARTFVQALAIGRDTARTASEVSISGSCNNALTRMMYCPQCRGLIDLRPCPSYCLSVTKSCLGQHIELESEWNQYIDALLLLADRLRSPFNIETVVMPIDVKISEAIMNLQEQGENISAKIFAECGKPRLSRRAAPSHRRFNLSTSAASNPGASPAVSTNLEVLSREAKEKLGSTKDFWSSLPAHLCGDYGKTFKNPVQEECWNGLSKSKSLLSASEVAAGVPSRMTKSADSVEASKSTSTAIAQQIQQLKLVTIKLKQAYNGVDVEWIETVSDDEDDGDDRASSQLSEGSGSGNGEIIDETSENIEEGSGQSSTPLSIITPVTVIHIVRIDKTSSKTMAPGVTSSTPDFEFETSTTTTTIKALVTASPSTSATKRPEIPATKATTTLPKIRSSAAALATSNALSCLALLFTSFVLVWR